MPAADSGKRRLAILGGGLAGLAAGYHARRNSLPFTIYEASDRIGGNAVTFRRGKFMFDAGAHRFHGLYPDVTREIQGLLGGNLRRIEAPSQICSQGKLVDFPLSPLNLALKIGTAAVLRAGVDFLDARLRNDHRGPNFEGFVVGTYGRYLAKRFLIDYSEKLWGRPADRLAPDIAGRRLQGLGFRTFLLEAFLGRKAKVSHLDGAFFYPKANGIGAIADKLLEYCGPASVRTRAPISRIHHGGGRIRAVEIGGREKQDVEEVISSIPMPEFLAGLDPRPPAPVLEAAGRLHFRSLVLVALFLNRPAVSANASIYFPDPAVPFTRVYEPRNRCRAMAPRRRTSLVAEIPCQSGDRSWNRADYDLIQDVLRPLVRMGFLKDADMTDAAVVRLPAVYPILDVDSVKARETIRAYLDGFANLSLTGRSGQFLYTHIHDQMKRGRDIIGALLK